MAHGLRAASTIAPENFFKLHKHDPSQYNRQTMRQSIAVLTAELSDAYQASVWKGLISAARKRSIRLVCFLGSRAEAVVVRESAANAVFDLADPKKFSGLIVISSAISTYLDANQVQYLFDAHEDSPKVSIGVPVQGASSITVEGRAAMISVTEHLVQVHGRRKFGIIAGPKWHEESEERRLAILDSLRAQNIHFDMHCLVYGSFEQDSGRSCAEQLLELEPDIDALICLNDRMALGAMDVIRDRGLRIPEDISLVGFDGIEETEFCNPPLTTVLQPLTELGAETVMELGRLMEGVEPRNRRLGCRPVFRESCGCSALATVARYSLPMASAQEFEDIKRSRQRLGSLARARKSLEFFRELNFILAERPFAQDEADLWVRFLMDLKREILEQDSSLAAEQLRGWADTLDHGLILVGELKRRNQGYLRMERNHRNNLVREVGISLSEAFDIPELLRRLEEGLVRLGIGEAYLVLYERERPEMARLLLSMGQKPRDSEILFSRKDYLPARLAESGISESWMLSPLVFQDEVFGHLILPGDIPDTEIYETLSKQVASSLTGALLMETVRRHEQSLEAEVKKRTEELIETNEALREEVETRIRLEQEVAEISKETMERIGRDLHDDLCQHLAGISLQVTALQSGLDPANDGQVARASLVAELLRDSIERAKAIVRGLLPPGLNEDGIIAAVKLFVDSLRKNSGIKIVFRGNAAWHQIKGDRAQELFRIIQEALNNSVKHSGADKISVKLGALDDNLIAEIQDNGTGIPEARNRDGMGLKIMRYRAEKARSSLQIMSGPEGTLVRCLVPAGGEE